MKQHSTLYSVLVALVFLLGVGLQGCDSANPIAPPGSLITVTANPTQIGLDQSSLITVAGFRPDGNPLNPGSTINLATDLGVLDQTVVTIGDNGSTTTRLRPDGRTGTATVTASLPAGEAMATATLQIGETDETRPQLLISADPSSIGIGQASEITVIARNSDGSNFGAGGQVQLRTTLGTLDDDLIVTDSNGEANTFLRAGSQSGTASVFATLGASNEEQVDVTIAEGTITLTSSPSRINIEQESDVSVILRTTDGAALQGATLQLRASLGSLDRDEVVTDANGEATATFSPVDSSGTARSGTADITATVEAGADVTTSITIVQSEVIVDVFPRIIDITDTAEVTVQLRDEDGIPLVAGHDVTMTANLGTLSPTVVTTNSQGIGRSTYTAGTRAGQDTIEAFFGNAPSATSTVDLRAAPASIILTTSTTTIAPNVDSTIVATATVTDAEGLLLANEVVNFSVTDGISVVFTPGRTDTTDSGGIATVTLNFESTTAPSAGQNFTITASARGGIQDSAQIIVQ